MDAETLVELRQAGEGPRVVRWGSLLFADAVVRLMVEGKLVSGAEAVVDQGLERSVRVRLAGKAGAA